MTRKHPANDKRPTVRIRPQEDSPRLAAGGGRDPQSLQRKLLPAVSFLLLALLVYLPSLRNAYIWDDDSYVTGSHNFQDLTGLKRIWIDPHSVPQYYPLVHSLFWLEYQLWGFRPAGYHLVNILLHGTVAFLIFLVLRRLKVPWPGACAALFAVHPVHVESVGWITELKNVLSAVFYLLAVLSWLRFFPPEADRPRRWVDYALTCFFFACGLLSKTVVSTLPAALLLIAWWKRGRILRSEALLIGPLFLLGLGFGAATAVIERTMVGAEGGAFGWSPLERALIAGRVLWFYAGKLLWPHPIVFIYPAWTPDTARPWHYLFPLAALAVLALLVYRHLRSRGPDGERRARGALAAVLFFAGSLMPALGFFNVYWFRFTFVADHFDYLASLGLLIPLVAVANRLHAIPRARSAVRATGGAMLLLLAALTWQRQAVYRNEESLWNDTLSKNPTCWMAHVNLGAYLERLDRVPEAADHYAQALRIKPRYARGENCLGVTLEKLGRPEQAEPHFLQAIADDPTFVMARMNLANLRARQRRFDEAIAQYQDVLARAPALVAARNNLGEILLHVGRPAEAVDQFQQALAVDPSQVEIWTDLGRALLGAGRSQEASEACRRAVALSPSFPSAHLCLGSALASLGRREDAAAEFREALRSDPANREARKLLEGMGAATAGP